MDVRHNDENATPPARTAGHENHLPRASFLTAELPPPHQDNVGGFGVGPFSERIQHVVREEKLRVAREARRVADFFERATKAVLSAYPNERQLSSPVMPKVVVRATGRIVIAWNER